MKLGIITLVGLCSATLWFGVADSNASSPLETPVSTQASSDPGPWMLAYFRQRYDSRVEIDTEGLPRNVPLPNPMRVERLHLALSRDGRHWTPLDGNRPVWDRWLRDPFLKREPDGCFCTTTA